MEDKKLKPVNLNVPLGSIESAQDRRAAYEKAAAKTGNTLSAWARETLDKAAGVKL